MSAYLMHLKIDYHNIIYINPQSMQNFWSHEVSRKPSSWKMVCTTILSSYPSFLNLFLFWKGLSGEHTCEHNARQYIWINAKETTPTWNIHNLLRGRIDEQMSITYINKGVIPILDYIFTTHNVVKMIQ